MTAWDSLCAPVERGDADARAGGMALPWTDLLLQRSGTAVFFPGGNAAANVALCLVDVQNLLDLQIQRAVELRQSLGDILMYGRLADAEFLRGGADGGPVLYNVKSQAFCPLLHVLFQTPSLPVSGCFNLMRVKRET